MFSNLLLVLLLFMVISPNLSRMSKLDDLLAFISDPYTFSTFLLDVVVYIPSVLMTLLLNLLFKTKSIEPQYYEYQLSLSVRNIKV